MRISSGVSSHSMQASEPQTPPKQNNEPSQESESEPVYVQVDRRQGETITLELEEYLIGVVSSEMSADFPLEALKAQAVAARTFVAKRDFHVDDTTASQVYQDNTQLKAVWADHYDANYEKIAQAVRETKGEILTYEGALISAAFFSSCNGYTNNAEDYWANYTPYLRSVESPWDKEIEGAKQVFTFSHEELAQYLSLEQPLTEIEPPQRYANGYVKDVVINGKSFSGRELRECLGLRSSAFTIQMTQDQIIITTQGFGHGIGMSQYGAKGMALAGSSYRDILLHYYTGVEIAQL